MTKEQTKTPRIILTGKLRSGKSTISTYLANEYGFHVMAFGDALKRTADELFEGSDVYPFTPITQNIPFSDGEVEVVGYNKPRRLYQEYGQAMRALDPDVWIRQVDQSLPVWENMRNINGIVVEDGRQLNEINWARANGFTVIRVEASESLRVERAEANGDDFDKESLDHETERHVDEFDVDYTIINDGDISDTERRIDEIMLVVMAEKPNDKGTV